MFELNSTPFKKLKIKNNRKNVALQSGAAEPFGSWIQDNGHLFKPTNLDNEHFVQPWKSDQHAGEDE